MKTLLIHLVLVCSLLMTGCGRKSSSKDTAPGTFAQAADPVAPPPKPINMVVVVDSGQSAATGTPVAEVMLTGGHTVELRLLDAVVGQPMEVTFEAQDEMRRVLRTGKMQGVPTNPNWVFMWNEGASYETNRAGRWTWTVSVKRGPTYTTTVSVLPPTPAEMDRVARNEEASENLLRAVSRYWLAHGEHLYAKLLRSAGTGGDTNPAYVQIRNWTPSLTLSPVDAVDQLNGITYRANASFTFAYFRTYSVENEGWSEWAEFPSGLVEFIVANTPEVKAPLSQLLKLSYTLMQKDKNWFLSVAGDGEVVNGARDPFKALYIVAPSPDEIKTLLARGPVPVRERDLARGLQASREAKPLSRSAIDTVTIIRGRTLR